MNSPKHGVSNNLEVIEISVQFTFQAGLVQELSYPMFAGTHFPYPWRDGELSQPYLYSGKSMWVKHKMGLFNDISLNLMVI